jgi:phosphate transport system permease protein
MSAAAHPSAAAPARSSGFAARAARSIPRRRGKSVVMVGLTFLAAGIATLPLVFILGYLVVKGAGVLSLDFFTRMPRPVGETGGGLAHAIVGTLMLVGIAMGVGLPIGVGAGLYLAEHRGTKLANVVRFLADVLNGLPSIVMGIFAWQFLVRPMGHFSALAGGAALGAMLVPLVTRTTEEMVRTVPNALREAALALGYPRWRTSIVIVLRTAMAGIVTGALVAIARIAGETAPLIFTVLGNQFWSTNLGEPIAALPLTIYEYAKSPYDDWHAKAWAGSLVLIFLVLVLSLVARAVTRGRHTGGD